MEKRCHVYILANTHRTVLYTRVTSDLAKRVWQHKTKQFPGFTNRCNVDRLVFFEDYFDPLVAIAREKQIKGGSRGKKIKLIEEMNPEWRDLYGDFFLIRTGNARPAGLEALSFTHGIVLPRTQEIASSLRSSQ